MKAIVFENFGEPREVLQVRDAPMPADPVAGEVRVRMKMAPINPSDLMTVRGAYGRLPTLPATPGFEGVGIIDAVGPGWLAKLRGLKPGRRVAVINGRGGNWAEYVVIPARTAVPIADDLPDEQVAAFFVNPATALVMTQRVLHVTRGGWLLQTGAGSALGRMVIKLGKHFGFRTINIVRRKDLVDELKQLGADEVLIATEEKIPARVAEITRGAMAPYALDCVGGPGVVEVIESLAPQGRLLVYGTLSGEPVPLDTRSLMGGQRAIEGFWLSEWVKAQGVLRMLGLFHQITSLVRAGVLTTPVAATYGFDQLPQAIEHVERQARGGKILLKLDGV
ncbi:MAG: zinc-dependent alcohol dehydrogenase family protein [Planctomycetes bacterium]|nr:zinc-dependent alcohol dehydrogenase family protein [Planctomycetota bacterium]